MTKLLDEGTVKKQSDLQYYPYRIVFLDDSNLAELHAFQKSVHESMADKSLYSPITVDMIRDNLGEKGLTLGFMVQDKLAGFINFYFPGNDVNNLGRDLDLSEQELAKVVHWERCLIDPDFRGNSMQKRLGALLVKAAGEMNKNYRYMCATVSPKNYPSLHQLFTQQNMLAVKLKIKYDGLWRLILFQDILNPIKVSTQGIIAVDCNDLERQKKLLSQGYFGFQAHQTVNGMEISFGIKCKEGSDYI